MGTHTYITSISKGRGKTLPKRLNFNPASMEAVSEPSDFVEDSSPDIQYVNLQTCRELVLDGVQQLFSAALDAYMWDDSDWFYTKKGKELAQKYDYYVGIKCRGEMYNKIAHIMRRYKGSAKTLTDFFNNLFGLKLKITYNILSKSDFANNNYLSTLIARTGGYPSGICKKKVLKGTVTIRFELRENRCRVLGCVISSIMALLREPYIVTRILNGRIKTKIDLLNTMMVISAARKRDKDKSYDCWTLTAESTEFYFYPEMQEKIYEALHSEGDDDGSDYRSIAFLAAFINNYHVLEDLNNIWGNESGPVEYVTENDPQYFLSCLEKTVKTSSYIQSVFDAIEIKDDYDDDIFDW